MTFPYLWSVAPIFRRSVLGSCVLKKLRGLGRLRRPKVFFPRRAAEGGDEG